MKILEFSLMNILIHIICSNWKPVSHVLSLLLFMADRKRFEKTVRRTWDIDKVTGHQQCDFIRMEKYVDSEGGYRHQRKCKKRKEKKLNQKKNAKKSIEKKSAKIWLYHKFRWWHHFDYINTVVLTYCKCRAQIIWFCLFLVLMGQTMFLRQWFVYNFQAVKSADVLFHHNTAWQISSENCIVQNKTKNVLTNEIRF